MTCPVLICERSRPRSSSESSLIQETRAKTAQTPEPAGDQEELSVSTPRSSSTVTAVSGNDGEVVGRHSFRTGGLDDGEPRWSGKTTTITHLSHERHMAQNTDSRP
ncbi:hypothetical protein EVAR_68134_1 [Eumeta japonica]|uniref:Uncharacterized protein n=1 Tax=Eumeta variegata TaxID=151549 RepID=A0A4C2AC17_EUMVA|nr:hypothetical protein EVAR_68134_1 [Eumeta japonica]